MGVDEGNQQVIDVEMILENCPITITVILNLLALYNCTPVAQRYLVTL